MQQQQQQNEKKGKEGKQIQNTPVGRKVKQ